MIKTCLRCHVEKPLDDFNRWKHSKDGRQGWCRLCQHAHDKVSGGPERSRRYYQAHREQIRERNREYFKRTYQARLPYSRQNSKMHRIRKRGALGRVTPAEWQTLLEQHQHACAYCFKAFTVVNKPTQDHVVPLIAGGTHTADNIVPACRSCNSRKQRRPLSTFLAELHQQPLGVADLSAGPPAVGLA